MDQFAQNEEMCAITGIADTQKESFIASSLFDQGWSVRYRALDADDLIAYVQECMSGDLTLFLSNDLDGLDLEKVEILRALSRRLYLFNCAVTPTHFDGEIDFPAQSLELANLLRSTYRAPLIQKQEPAKPATARIIGIAATSHGLGCTTFAVNLAHELSLLDASVLLVDADAQSPSIADALDERSLHNLGSWKERPGKASLMELSQNLISENISNLDRASRTFNFIILDLSVLSPLSQSLMSRRWDSQAAIWASNSANELWFLTKSQSRNLRALARTAEELRRNEIKPRIRFIAMEEEKGRRERNSLDSISQQTKGIEQGAPLSLPVDSKNVHIAESHKVPLAECNERGVLRRAIKGIAEKVRA